MASFSVDAEIIQELHGNLAIPKSSKEICPLHVDKFTMVNNIRSEQNTNHFWSIQHTVLRGNEDIKGDHSHFKKIDLGSSVENKFQNKYKLEKLEESYWSKWKPNKKGILLEAVDVLKNKSAENIHNEIIKTEQENIKLFSTRDVHSHCTAKSNEIIDGSLEEINSCTKHNSEINLNSNTPNESENGTKSQYQKQIYLRTFKNSSSYIKGGSYPLRSCPKKNASINIKAKLNNKSQYNNSLRSKNRKMTISRFCI
ncbi:hypothetical protein WA026_006257 [Henosepilachna vigintioctopunctata]|uniref:Uncharacterized protein n=1 Tax=Henosepilachna vigintioctopunctata TaxID=420089 RepID=A0AAW1TQ21_9CUCU